MYSFRAAAGQVLPLPCQGQNTEKYKQAAAWCSKRPLISGGMHDKSLMAMHDHTEV